jgi:hypothetical protein
MYSLASSLMRLNSSAELVTTDAAATLKNKKQSKYNLLDFCRIKSTFLR